MDHERAEPILSAAVSRREFLLAGAAAIPVMGAAGASARSVEAPAVISSRATRPCVVASANGFGGAQLAHQMLLEGADPLDAILAGVRIVELDPNQGGVGFGGRPKENGVVQLDASCMHGPTKRAGAVAALEGIATPSLVAKAVMDYTNHVFLTGGGAKDFALAMGFKEQELLTEGTKQEWLEWKAGRRRGWGDPWIDDKAREAWRRWNADRKSGVKSDASPPDTVWEADASSEWAHDTVHMSAVAANGDLSSCTSTSGSFRLAGGVGDSPVIGAGQYCDNDVGAAGATGRGEAAIKVCGAFLTAEGMRRGLSPTEACLETLRRVVAMTEARLLDEQGRPKFGLVIFAVNKRGEFGGAILSDNYPFETYAVVDANGARLVALTPLYDRTAKMGRDPIGTRREIALHPAQLDRFVGEYAESPSYSIVITKENGSLWAQPTGNRRAQLFAEAPTEFFLKVADMQLSFVSDASGRVTSLVVTLNGRKGRPMQKVR